MHVLDNINKILEVMTKSALAFSAFIIYPFIVGIIIFDVGGRYLFNSPLSWGTEGSGILLIMAIFLVCAQVDTDDAHIRLDIFYANFNPRVKCLVKILTSLVAGWWVYLLTSRSYEEIFYSIHMHESGMDVTLPYWPVRVVMTFAFGLLGVHLLLSLLVNFSKLIQGGAHA